MVGTVVGCAGGFVIVPNLNGIVGFIENILQKEIDFFLLVDHLQINIKQNYMIKFTIFLYQEVV